MLHAAQFMSRCVVNSLALYQNVSYAAPTCQQRSDARLREQRQPDCDITQHILCLF